MYKIPPTKSALLALKKRVLFLEQGHALLERKKELLTRLVYERLRAYRALRIEAKTALQQAYACLSVTQLRMGARSIRQMALGLPPALEVQILARSSLGVQYPTVQTMRLAMEPLGLLGTDASFDETRARFAAMAETLAQLGEAETALWRLLEEQRKTQKRVNALKYNLIPQYQATIRWVQSTLEEDERNALFQIKMLREPPTDAARTL